MEVKLIKGSKIQSKSSEPRLLSESENLKNRTVVMVNVIDSVDTPVHVLNDAMHESKIAIKH